MALIRCDLVHAGAIRGGVRHSTITLTLDRHTHVARDEQLPGFAHEGSGLIPQSLTGDGHVLGAEIGGIVHKVENSLRVMLSYTIPAEAPGGAATSVHAGIVELCSPHTLLVNRDGRRFADETFYGASCPTDCCRCGGVSLWANSSRPRGPTRTGTGYSCPCHCKPCGTDRNSTPALSDLE